MGMTNHRSIIPSWKGRVIHLVDFSTKSIGMSCRWGFKSPQIYKSRSVAGIGAKKNFFWIHLSHMKC